MRSQAWRLGVAAGAVLLGLAAAAPASAQQTSTSTEVKSFEVVSVDGNKVVIKERTGAREVTVPNDFRVTVDGRSVPVSELRPGMKGSATITTTTTTKPVYVTEVRNAEVVNVAGSTIIVRGPNGFRSFTQGEIDKRGVKIIKDGQPAELSAFHAGDRLTATIVTEGPPQVLTQRQVQATLSAAGATAAGSTAARPAASAASPSRSTGSAGSAGAAPSTTATPGAASASPRKLPKTASLMPLAGLSGAAALALGLTMTLLRRRDR
jgi:hypothetical protein